MNRIVFIAMYCIYFCQVAVAQHQETFDDYRREAGEHASLFRGKIERGYSPYEYVNHPYWVNDAFSQGEVMYDGLLYTGLSIRYDTYLNCLIVQTPIRKVHVYVEMSRVEYFTLDKLRFVRQGDTFVALHYDSPRMELVQRMECKIGNPVTKDGVSYKNFKCVPRYLLQRGGESYEVKALSSVLKLFPAEKKMLKQFAKEHHLDFKDNRTASLVAVITYVDRITQP